MMTIYGLFTLLETAMSNFDGIIRSRQTICNTIPNISQCDGGERSCSADRVYTIPTIVQGSLIFMKISPKFHLSCLLLTLDARWASIIIKRPMTSVQKIRLGQWRPFAKFAILMLKPIQP